MTRRPPDRSARDATPAELVEPILAARRILAICHVNPDGDAIGALLGLGHILHAVPGEREVVLACHDPAPATLHFVPGAESIVPTLPSGFLPEVVISLDASDPARLGTVFRDLEFDRALLIVIDHHITNLRFGDLNYVAPQVASTSQLVVRLADALGVALPREAATPLLVGLVTDTLGFRTSNVTTAELQCAERLMDSGADLADICQRTLTSRPLKFMRLWGTAFSSARLDGVVLWAEVTKEMRVAAGIDDDDDGGLVSQLIHVAEARIAVVFNELSDGRIEVDFRARPPYDVAAVALSLGGGGHPQASGCTLPGPLNDVRARVLPLLQEASKDVR